MRVIPINGGPTLFVLETVDRNRMQIHICKSSSGGLIAYFEERRVIYTIEDLEDSIEVTSNSWQKETNTLLKKARHEMQKHIRDERIEGLLRGDDFDPYLWA